MGNIKYNTFFFYDFTKIEMKCYKFQLNKDMLFKILCPIYRKGCQDSFFKVKYFYRK